MYFDKEAECWVDPGDPESLKALEEAKKQKEPERAQVAQALEKFGAMTDQDLKLELRGRGLPTEGGREDFMERLTEAAKQEAKKAVAEAREMAALLEAQKKPSAPAVAADTSAADPMMLPPAPSRRRTKAKPRSSMLAEETAAPTPGFFMPGAAPAPAPAAAAAGSADAPPAGMPPPGAPPGEVHAQVPRTEQPWVVKAREDAAAEQLGELSAWDPGEPAPDATSKTKKKKKKKSKKKKAEDGEAAEGEEKKRKKKAKKKKAADDGSSTPKKKKKKKAAKVGAASSPKAISRLASPRGAAGAV